MNAEDHPAAPLLRVVRGDPTAEELAALVVVVSTRMPGEASPAFPAKARPARSDWGAPHRRLRQPIRPGPGAWQGSALPR